MKKLILLLKYNHLFKIAIAAFLAFIGLSSNGLLTPGTLWADLTLWTGYFGLIVLMVYFVVMMFHAVKNLFK